MDFGYCQDCKEFCYSLRTKNGVFKRGSEANNHQNCKGWIDFDKPPETYPPPIKNVLTKLNAGLEINDNEIILLKLSLALDFDMDFYS